MSKVSFSLSSGLAAILVFLGICAISLVSHAETLPQKQKFFSLASLRQPKGNAMLLPDSSGPISIAGYRNRTGKPLPLTVTRLMTAPSVEEMKAQMAKTKAAKDHKPAPSEALNYQIPSDGDKPYQWPLKEAENQHISSPFGNRSDPITGKRAFHAGVDIAAPVGTPVLASADGTVDTVTSHARLGKYVKIQHDGETYSLYGHLKNTSVAEGDTVKAGQVIGQVGMTGRTTGPHLDFSLRENGKPVNPLPKMEMPEHGVALARK